MTNKKMYKAIDEMLERKSYEFGQKKVTRKILYKYRKTFDWESICIKQDLTEAMIEDFISYLNWDDVCLHQRLSEDFIRKHMNQVNWNYITTGQRISASFVREFKDYVSWRVISRMRNVNDINFFEEFRDKIDWTVVMNDRESLNGVTVEEVAKRYNIIRDHHCYGDYYVWRVNHAS